MLDCGSDMFIFDYICQDSRMRTRAGDSKLDRAYSNKVALSAHGFESVVYLLYVYITGIRNLGGTPMSCIMMCSGGLRRVPKRLISIRAVCMIVVFVDSLHFESQTANSVLSLAIVLSLET